MGKCQFSQYFHFTPRFAENLKIFSINSWKSAHCMHYIRLMCLHQTTEEYYNIPFNVWPGQWSHSGKVMWHAGCCRKTRWLSGLFWRRKKIRCFSEHQILQQCKTIGEIFLDFVQNFSKKKKIRVLLCNANAWIGTHAMFPVIPKRCCRFSVQSFQFKITTHLM